MKNEFEQEVDAMIQSMEKVVRKFPKEINRLKKEMTKEDAEKLASVFKEADIDGKFKDYDTAKKQLYDKLG